MLINSNIYQSLLFFAGCGSDISDHIKKSPAKNLHKRSTRHLTSQQSAAKSRREAKLEEGKTNFIFYIKYMK